MVCATNQAEGKVELSDVSRENALEVDCLRALVGGRDAWDSFLDLFHKTIYYGFHALPARDSDLLDDLYQELAVQLMRDDWRIVRAHLDNYQEYSFRHILRYIVRNVLVDELRRRKRWYTQPLDDLDLLELSAAPRWACDPAKVRAWEERVALILEEAVGGREKAAFKILFLRYVGGYSVNSIAEALGMNPNAVTKQIGYYLKKLRELLQQPAELGHD